MTTHIQVQRTRLGPIERIHLTAPDRDVPAAQSVYRIGDTLIDSAGTRVTAALIEALRDTPPRRVLCTHQHEDHVGGVPGLRRAFGHIPVYLARPYLPIVREPKRIPPYRVRYWGDAEPIDDAIGFDAGETFEVDGYTLETLDTPGHTPHHITFILRTHDATYACTGDLFTSAKPFVAWYESAADDAIRSCRAVAEVGPDLHMLPTHGRLRGAQSSDALLTLAAALEERAQAVLAAAEQLRTRDYAQLARAVFGGGDAAQARASRNEFAYGNFVRSVLDPVRSLPTTPFTVW